MPAPARIIVPLVLSCLGWPPSPAVAQQTRATEASKWEVEVHAGRLTGGGSASGTAIAEFPVGLPVPTGAGTMNTRAVSSWYFGDGATLVNQAFGMLGFPARIAPLDAMLKERFVERPAGGSGGLRVSRQLTPRYSAEFNLDYARVSLEIVEDAENALEASRASFPPVWRTLFATNSTISSTLELSRGSAQQQLIAAGALNIRLGGSPRVAPYVIVGAGSLFNRGTTPSATLTGVYQFALVGMTAVDERDTVTVHAVVKERTFVGVLGGGVRFQLAARHGVRADLRVNLSDNPVDLTVDASPAVTFHTPGSILFVPTTPALQFSTSQIQNRRSSLSGPAVEGLKTFTGTGVRTQVNVSIGYFFRF